MKTITFNGYSFQFWLLTTRNVYEPAAFAVTQTSAGMIAQSDAFTYGDGTAETPGLMRVIFSQAEHGISWQANAEHGEPIKGIKCAISPLPVGRVLVPLGTEYNLQEDEPGRCVIYPGGYYPLRHVSSTAVEPEAGPLGTWAAQFALLIGGERTLFLQAREYPPRTKKLWVYRRGGHQEFRLYSEADACRRATEYNAPKWHLDETPNWRQAVDEYAEWMANSFGLRPFVERHDVQTWLPGIGLVVFVHGLSADGKACHNFADMVQRLEELALLFPPSRTLVKLLGFEGRIDCHWPNNAPASELGGAEGFADLTRAAQRLGFHIMPHLNVWGASFDNSATKGLLAHRILDGEGRPVNWSYDYDQDEIAEEIFAYISPDAPEWRQVLRKKVANIVARGMDAVFLDQTGTYINDLRHDHYRGLRALYAELRGDLSKVQFTCEGPTTELSVSLSPLLAGVWVGDSEELVEIYHRLFGPYVRLHGHSASVPPEPYRGVWSVPPAEWWSEEGFAAHQQRVVLADAIPTLNLTDRRIGLDSERVTNVLDQARRIAGAEQGA